jgi:hypothetical protein
MNLATFYLVCFVVGFALSVLSFLMGVHLPGKLHLPHLGLHHGGHVHVHLPHAGGHAAPSAAARAGAPAGGEVSPINFVTLMAFLTWFGGIGYILTRYSALLGAFALLLAVLGGLGGASIIFLFMAKVLVQPDENRAGHARAPPRAPKTPASSKRVRRSWSRASKRESPTSAAGRT